MIFVNAPGILRYNGGMFFWEACLWLEDTR